MHLNFAGTAVAGTTTPARNHTPATYLRGIFVVRLNSQLAGAAAVVAALSLSTPAHATVEDAGASFDLTGVDLTVVALDGAGSTCSTSIGSPRIAFSRPAGGTSLSEGASVTGKTTCAGGVTAYAQIVDVSPTMTTAATNRAAYSGTYTRGTATATANASQLVQYFQVGPAGVTVATRPVSYVTMQVAARNRYATVCLEYQFTIVNGSQIVPVGAKGC